MNNSLIFVILHKIQKYEPLHNSQDEVSRQMDVHLQKDAFLYEFNAGIFSNQEKFPLD
jgi:hypothetical protein